MRKIWINKANSFEEANRFDDDYYRKMSPSERVEAVQVLRGMYFRTHRELYNGVREGLRRSIKVIQRT